VIFEMQDFSKAKLDAAAAFQDREEAERFLKLSKPVHDIAPDA
jgi:hypothetical protein